MMSSVWQYYSSGRRSQILGERSQQYIVLVVIHTITPFLVYHLLTWSNDEQSFNINFALTVLFCTLDVMTLSNMWALGLAHQDDFAYYRLYK